MMNRISTLVLVFVLFVAGTASAATLDGRCSIRFFGESTLHDFDGQVACQPFVLQSSEAENGVHVVSQPVVTVLVNEMDTDNSKRDKKMRSMFDSEHFPEIRGVFADLKLQPGPEQLVTPQDIPDELEFDLQIREVTQHVRAKTSQVALTPEQVDFVLEFPLSLSSYSLEPPSVLGFIRVADEVRVEVKVTLIPDAAGQP